MSKVENKQAPEELVKQCEELNKQWLSSCGVTAVPVYLESDFSSEWRIEVRANEGNTILIQHLQPSFVHGHTLYVAVCGIKYAYDRGVKDGRKAAVANICDAITKAANTTALQRITNETTYFG